MSRPWDGFPPGIRKRKLASPEHILRFITEGQLVYDARTSGISKGTFAVENKEWTIEEKPITSKYDFFLDGKPMDGEDVAAVRIGGGSNLTITVYLFEKHWRTGERIPYYEGADENVGGFAAMKAPGNVEARLKELPSKEEVTTYLESLQDAVDKDFRDAKFGEIFGGVSPVKLEAPTYEDFIREGLANPRHARLAAVPNPKGLPSVEDVEDFQEKVRMIMSGQWKPDMEFLSALLASVAEIIEEVDPSKEELDEATKELRTVIDKRLNILTVRMEPSTPKNVSIQDQAYQWIGTEWNGNGWVADPANIVIADKDSSGHVEFNVGGTVKVDIPYSTGQQWMETSGNVVRMPDGTVMAYTIQSSQNT